MEKLLQGLLCCVSYTSSAVCGIHAKQVICIGLLKSGLAKKKEGTVPNIYTLISRAAPFPGPLIRKGAYLFLPCCQNIMHDSSAFTHMLLPEGISLRMVWNEAEDPPLATQCAVSVFEL